MITKLNHIVLPKTRAYVKSFGDQTKRLHFVVEGDIEKIEYCLG